LNTEVLVPGQVPGVTSSVARLPGAAPSLAVVPRPTFAVVYDEHFDFVWRTARRLGIPEAAAEDVVQDTFLVLHRRLRDYDGATPIKRWILGITMHVVADHRRRFRRKDGRCIPHAADSNGDFLIASTRPPPSQEAEQSEAVQLLQKLLEELDEDKREVLVLAQLEEMTVPEIAEMLGANVNTIYARLRAARREFDAAHTRYRARTSRMELP
jgi:RNA polymerase sigma-70 factor (ECF subfamily)